MLRRAVLCALTLGVSASCASIDGKKVEQEMQDPSTSSSTGGGDDAGPAATTGGQDMTGTTGNTGTTGDTNPATDAGADVDAGNSGGDAGTPPTPADGTCNAPYVLQLSGNKANVTGVTTGKAETLTPKCSPAGNGLTGGGLAGPDQVYKLTMPFKGTVSAKATGTAGFPASVYVLTGCGNSATEKACSYEGTLRYVANAGAELFVYVDSGSTTGLLTSPPVAGGYALAVSVRPEAAEGEACGASATEAYCAASLNCRAGKCASGAAVCGDGFAEGSEECDDKNEATGDGCAACKLESDRDSCADAPTLVFRDENGALVARASGSTTAATDELSPSCASGAAVDHMYSFTLTSASSVRVELLPADGYDTTLAILDGECSSSATEIACEDAPTATDPETYTGSLAAGTYFIVVDGYSNTSKGDYELTVTASP